MERCYLQNNQVQTIQMFNKNFCSIHLL